MAAFFMCYGLATSSASLHLLVAETINQMIVHQPASLHMRIHHGAAYKLESALRQVFTQCIGFGCGGRYFA